MPESNPELISIAQQFTGLPMRDLIGGPLTAAAEANSMMAMTQTEFLLSTAFSRQDGGEGESSTYAPVIIQMTLQRPVITPGDAGQPPNVVMSTTRFDLPLLTILPLNSLAVSSVNIDFDMEVKSSYGEETSEATKKQLKTESTFEAKLSLGPFSVKVQGNVAYDSGSSSSRDTHYEKSNSAQYKVNVQAGQLPLPQGVNTIIQAFTNSIQPVELPASQAAPSSSASASSTPNPTPAPAAPAAPT